MDPLRLVREMRKLLALTTGWIDKAEAHAAAKGYDAAVLLQARLAPDMFPLLRQFQSACDSAKFAAAFTAGKEPPAHPDSESTWAEVRARVASVVAYLDTFGAEDFAGLDARSVRRPRWEGKSMAAADYLVEQGLPNFFFHLTTAYALLRHAGVDVGKRDYLGPLSFR